MVIPRSRSIGLLSSTCASISRSVRPPHSWMMRSASVDLPWSTWAMMEKLRMLRIGPGCERPVCRAKRGIIAWARGPGPGPGTGLAPGPAPGSGHHGDEAGAAAAVDQQHHAVAGLHVAQCAIERGRGTDGGPADAQDHVARAQAGAARGVALHLRQRDALAR